MGRPAGPTRDTKALICERALDVFAEKGYTASTMRDIAHGAGVKDASLYNHFSSKRDLFDATVSLQLERLTSLLRSHQALAHPEDSTAAYATDDPNQLLSTVLASRSFQTRLSSSCGTSSKRSDTPTQASSSSTARYSSRGQSSCRRRSSPSSSHADTSVSAIWSSPPGNSTERCS